ncbi:hypothetical protein EMCRGX_G020829 [Ephydatia muelleri]
MTAGELCLQEKKLQQIMEMLVINLPQQDLLGSRRYSTIMVMGRETWELTLSLHAEEAPTHTQKCTCSLEINSHHIKQQLPGLSTLASDKPSAVQAIRPPLPPRMSRLGKREHLTSGGKRSVGLPADFNKFTWRSTISSSHGGPVQGPSPVHMEVQCRVHLQFTWRSSAGPISSSHGGPVQGPSPPSPVHMEVQCRVHLLNQVQHKLGCCQQGLHHQGTRLEGRGQHTHHLHPGWTPIYVGPMQQQGT